MRTESLTRTEFWAISSDPFLWGEETFSCQVSLLQHDILVIPGCRSLEGDYHLTSLSEENLLENRGIDEMESRKVKCNSRGCLYMFEIIVKQFISYMKFYLNANGPSSCQVNPRD